ncbi:MAG TPA: TonB-dependent receptor [Candidatus Acidoferrum sp.]|nr:TonB-dependent receptor [Candidatus Acidoferrum sp.]
MLTVSPPSLAQEKLEEITVTGSRIVRRDYEAASPIVTVGSDAFNQVSNLGVESALNQLPQFQPAQTQFSSGDIQSSAFNAPGIATLNLRGLGSNRNLILVDGRRAQPSNALLVVDVNTIPSAAIESVEVISGGASAVYGADALGGVTNFKLKRNFEGFNLSVQTSADEQGGGAETKVSALIGGRFGNNGNVMFGVEGAKRQAVKNTDRDFFLNGYLDPGTTSSASLRYVSYKPGSVAAGPSVAATNAMFGAGKFNAASDSIFINPDGKSLFINTATGGAVGYTGPLNNGEFKIVQGVTAAGTLNENIMYTNISSPLSRYSMFARANYDLNSTTRVYLQGNLTHSTVDTVAGYSPALSQWNVTIPRDGRALPAQLNTLLDSRANPSAPWTLEMGFVDFAGERRNVNSDQVFQLLAGIEGDIGKTGWTYDAYASHGETSLIAELFGYPLLSNFRALMQAPNFGQNYTAGSGPPLFFQIKCTSGLPVFTKFTPSQDCIDSLDADMKHLTTMQQDIVEINATGDVFKLPAGTIQGALGVSTRKNSFKWRPDALLETTSQDYPIGLFPTSPTTGTTKVTEFYGEAVVPVVKNLPAIKAFNLELGARYSDYNTAGGIWTYKSLIDWKVNDDLTIRGGYQLANRAPNTAELFLGPNTSVVSFPGGDPCLTNTLNTWGNVPSNPNQAKVVALCELIDEKSGYPNTPYKTNPNAIVGPFPFNFPFELAIISGNPNLKNEEAKTWTMGFVMKSPFQGLFERATLSVDWYQIKIKDAIAPGSSWSVYAKCFNQDGSNPTYAYNDSCALIARDQDGYRATVITPYYNLGGIETAGVDVQLNWGFDALGGKLNLVSVINFLDYFRDQQTATDPVIDRTGTLSGLGGGPGGNYDYRVFNTLSYMRDSWSVGLRHSFLPAIKDASYATNKATTILGPGSYNLFNAFASYTFSKQLTIRGGIDNLFDRDPEVVGRNPGITNANGSTSPGFYDPLGRRYYVAFDFNF